MGLALLLISVIGYGQSVERAALSVEGTVSAMKVNHENSLVRVRLDLELSFTNKGDESLVLLKPGDGLPAQMYWQGGQSVALSRTHCRRGEFVWSSQLWPSISTSEEFRKAAAELEESKPQGALTLVLKPREMWKWKTWVELRFYEKTASCCSSMDLGWEVVGKLGVPLWMRLDYLVWPENLERAAPGLRKRLQKRLANIGRLYTDSRVTTEPIEIRLSEAMEK